MQFIDSEVHEEPFVRLFRLLFFFLIVAVLNSFAETSSNPSKPVTERELLCLIIGRIPYFNIQYELQTRGAAFAFNEEWVDALKKAGEGGILLTTLQQTKPASIGEAVRDEYAERLFRIIKEKNDKKLDAAKLHIAGLAKLDKSNPDFLLALGGFLNYREEFDEAIPPLTRAVELAPDFIYAHEQLAFAYFKMRMRDPAMSEIKVAAAIRPDDPDVHKIRGNIYLGTYDFRNADREYYEALKLRPDYAIVYRNLANSAAIRKQDLEVIKFEHKAEALDPTDYNFYWGEGDAYSHLGRTNEAIAAYKRAKELAPDDMRIRQNLGAQYCNSGRNEDAVAEFQELLALDPDWNMARECLYKSLVRLGRLDEARTVKQEHDRREAADPN